MHSRDGENMHSFLVCALLLMEDITGSYFLSGPEKKSDLRLNLLMQSLTGNWVLLRTNSIFVEWTRGTVQSTFTNNLLTLVLRWDSKQEWRDKQAGGWIQMWDRWFLCRQDRRNFTALGTTKYQIWQKLHLGNLSYMAPEVASPGSKPSL